jgi:DNA-directed RNA polymerase specialized sigma24 family protein
MSSYPKREQGRGWAVLTKLLVIGSLAVLVGRSGIGCSDASPATSSGPSVAASASTLIDADEAQRVNACIATLSDTELRRVQRHVQWSFHLTLDDAVDIARDSLLVVCVAHAAKPYENLGGAFTTTAQRRARDWRFERYVRCAVDVSDVQCVVAPEAERMVAADQIVSAIICREDATHQRVIYGHLRGESFQDIGKKLGISSDAARDKWNNAVKRIRRRFAEKCGA